MPTTPYFKDPEYWRQRAEEARVSRSRPLNLRLQARMASLPIEIALVSFQSNV